MIVIEFLPTGPVRLAARIGGGAMLFSTLAYAFFGLPMWAPTEPHDMRSLVLVVVHIAGIAAFVGSFYRDSDAVKRDAERRIHEAVRDADRRVEQLRMEMRKEIDDLRRGLALKTEVLK